MRLELDYFLVAYYFASSYHQCLPMQKAVNVMEMSRECAEINVK